MTSIDLPAHPVTPTSFGRWQPLNAPLGCDGVRDQRDGVRPRRAVHHRARRGGDGPAGGVYRRRRPGRSSRSATRRLRPARARSSRSPIRAVTRGFDCARPGHADRLRRRGACRQRAGLRRVDHRCRGRRRRPRPLTRPAVRARRPPPERGRSRRRCCSAPRRPGRPRRVLQAEPLHQLERVVVAVPHEDAARRRALGDLRPVPCPATLKPPSAPAGRGRGCRTR